MKFDTIISLVKEGYTEEQIRQIEKIMDGEGGTKTSPAPAPAPAPTPEKPVDTDKTPAPAATPKDKPQAGTAKPDANTADINKEESETVTLLREMLGLIQKGNINNLSQSMDKPSEQMDGAAVLASIINPQTERGVKNG